MRAARPARRRAARRPSRGGCRAPPLQGRSFRPPTPPRWLWMRSTKLVFGGAAAGAIGVRVARSLYGHWRLLPATDRDRIAAFAEDTKEKALSLRGSKDRVRAEA